MPPRAVRPAEPRQRKETPLNSEAHGDNLTHGNRKVPIHRLELRNITYFWHAASRDLLAEDSNRSGHARHRSEQSTKEGRLARARGTDDAHERSSSDRQGQVFDYWRA